MEDRKRIEDLYAVMLVCSKAGHDVAKVVTPALGLAGCLGITVATYLSLAELHLAFLWRIFSALSATAGAAIMFQQIYESVCFTRASQGIIARLLSMEQSYFQGMGRKERNAVMKRAKAFRPLVIPIGDFCNASMGVIEVAWEEILNDVLFLLSL